MGAAFRCGGASCAGRFLVQIQCFRPSRWLCTINRERWRHRNQLGHRRHGRRGRRRRDCLCHRRHLFRGRNRRYHRRNWCRGSRRRRRRGSRQRRALDHRCGHGCNGLRRDWQGSSSRWSHWSRGRRGLGLLATQLLHLGNPVLDLTAIIHGDALLAPQILAQIGQRRLGSVQIVIAGPEIAREHQHVRIVAAQTQKDSGRGFILARFVELPRLFDLGGVFRGQASSQRASFAHWH